MMFSQLLAQDDGRGRGRAAVLLFANIHIINTYGRGRGRVSALLFANIHIT